MPVVLFFGCYPTTKITGSWKNEKATKSYKSIFVAALTKNTIIKSTVENDLSFALNSYSVATLKSLDEFPPSFAQDSVPKEEMMTTVKRKGNEAILTISIQKKTTESRYIGGAYTPVGRFGYYGNFWGYYSHWYPYGYNDAYYTQDEIYYLETNLYDAKDEVLIWSAQSKTYTYDALTTFSKEFAKNITERMRKDGIIP
ncbi:MAG: hypothetical protein K0S32_3565 [Bacteroidetes bacterium]|nr:hypothetical protein [Bacteroidota bacterium]